jgi:ketosteroid isomerase-like protein
MNVDIGDTDPVSAAFAWYAASAYAKDVDAFVTIYTHDVHVFDMWNQWELRGIEAWRDMAKGWLGSLGDGRVAVRFSDVASVVSANLALGHATVTYTAESADGKVLRSLDNRMTIAMRREGGLWKIFHEHTSGPIAHESMKGIIRRTSTA